MENGLPRSLASDPAGPGSPDGGQPDDSVLFVFPPDRPLGRGLELACTVAETLEARLVILRPVTLPRQTPLAPESEEFDPHRRVVQQTSDEALDRGLEAEGDLWVGHKVHHMVSQAANKHSARVVLLPGRPPLGSTGGLSKGETRQIMEHTEVPVVVYGEPPVPVETTRIRLAMSGGPHSEGMMAWGTLMAEAWAVPVDLFHVLDPSEGAGEQREAEEELERIAREIDLPWEVTWRAMEAESLKRAVLANCEPEDALVLGAPTRSRWRHVFYGSRARKAQRTSPGWSFVVHTP